MAFAGALRRGLSFFEDPNSELSRRAFVYFRWFLTVKIASPFIFENGVRAGLTLTPVAFFALAALLLSGLKKYYWFGTFILFGLSATEVWQSWPYTLNHIALETFILVFILLEAEAEDNLAPLMIKAVLVSVWIYSGMQKLFHGYFFSGEYLALETLSGESHLGKNLAWILHYVESVFGTEKFSPLICCGGADLILPAWEVFLFRAMGVMTVLTEIFLPLTLLFRKTRLIGVILLFLFQLTIGLSSAEIDFAFTAVAILLLFEPRVARVAYPVLGFFYLVVSPWH